MSFRNFRGRTIGAAKVVAEGPISDGSAALEIHNWRLDEQGVLDSTFRLMPFIPDQWRAGSAVPLAFQAGVVGMGFVRMFGETPEILFLSYPYSVGNATGGSVWRYTPWRRGVGGTNPGLEAQVYYPRAGLATQDVRCQSKLRYPPQVQSVGNRLYFTFCDGGGAWVWDGVRCRLFGYTAAPSAPTVEGPSRFSLESPNGGGFSVRGRIGNSDASFTTSDNKTAPTSITTGGIDVGSWQYAVVWENCDGAYSPTSPMSGPATIRVQMADPTKEGGQVEDLTRKFRLSSIPVGPVGTRARVLLRTRNQQRLPAGDDGSPRFLTRLPNNVGPEWVDDIPDGELGPLWETRVAVPVGVYFMRFFSGSMFLMRNDGHPSRVWWSEQGNLNGPTPESLMQGHYRDVFPATGPIMASMSTRTTTTQEPPAMLIFKEEATHFVTGTYPDWTFGTLHTTAGCAGPGLVQLGGDGSVIWYGSSTFWRMDPEGRIQDIGAPLRRKLRRINTRVAEYGVSWVDPRAGEVVFALPYKDSAVNNYQFVWDWRIGGWRTRSDLIVTAALPVPGTELVLVSGSYDGKTNVWVYGRGYPNYAVTQPLAIYRTGWATFDRPGSPGMHGAFNAHDLILTMEERSSGTATLRLYQDWSLDTAINTETVPLVHPENDNVPFYASARYGTGVWRERRVFHQRAAIDVPSASTLVAEIAVQGAMALVSMDMYGPQVALPGSRTPAAE